MRTSHETSAAGTTRIALIEAGSPGLNIYSHVAMGRGIALLATVLHDHGFESRAFIEDVSGKGTVDWEWVSLADIVGFSAITCTMPRTRELLEIARIVNPEAVVVFGGPEPTCEPRRSLEAGADFVLRGEAEHTLPRFINAHVGHSLEPLGNIEGLIWVENDEMRSGPEPRQLTAAELDELPLVDRTLVYGWEQTSVATAWRTRGCPQRCDFCEVCEIWPRPTRRSDERAADEVIAAQEAGFRTVFLVDDNAAANKSSFKDFLRSITERGFSETLVAQLRADAVFKGNGRLDRELLRLLRRAAGLTVVCVGVESADDANLARVHKRVDARRMARGLKAMRRYGLLVHGMFIALNEDTREIIRRNGAYARRYVTSLQYLFETPLPGTKSTLEHELKGEILFGTGDDLGLADGMHVVLRPVQMSAREMQELVGREYRRFYSRARIVREALRATFVRHRRLTAAQRATVATLAGWERFKTWVRFHAQYTFAPTAFLAIGRRRIRDVMRDPAFVEYLARLDRLELDLAPSRSGQGQLSAE
jgi:radical SAM superfamily enzyme YgiQ (UPF0313 family)